MKKLFLAVLIFLTACTKEDPFYKFVHPDPDAPSVVQQKINNPLFIFTGESNSGGEVPNSFASPAELAPRSSVIIMNNSNERHRFEPLDIGTNAMFGHSGLDNTTHGWELGLANDVDSGIFSVHVVHLIKTGQGGSRIAHWLTDSTIYNDQYPWRYMRDRINAALAQDATYTPIIFYSQGINDVTAGTDSLVWKQATKNHLHKIRAQWPNVPIVMTKFFGPWTKYNIMIDQICAEEANTWSVETSDLPLLDDKHWDYNGMKTLATRMIKRIKQHYQL